MKNRFLSIIIALSLILTSMATVASAKSEFPDVLSPDHDWCSKQIETMTDMGLIKGYTDGSFKPDKAISKIEALILFARVAGYTEDAYSKVVDFANNKYRYILEELELDAYDAYKGEISFLLYKGVIAEDEVVEYLEDEQYLDEFPRKDAAILISKMMDAEIKSTTSKELEFADKDDIKNSDAGYIAYVVENGFMNGVELEDGSVVFDADKALSRAQVCVLLYRIVRNLDMSVESGVVFDIGSEGGVVAFENEEGEDKSYVIPKEAKDFVDGEAGAVSDILENSDIVVVRHGKTIYSVDIINPESNKTVKGVLLYTAQSSLANLITSVGIVGSLWCGMILVSRNVLSIGTLLTYYSLLVYSLGAVERLIGFIPQFLTAGITAERLNDIFDLTPERLIAQKTICANDIRIEDLDFRYGNRERVLHKVALSINAGETIAFVGESGSGKTTLAKLIMGFYPPENGAIFIGGADISTLSQKSVREQISYISQEVFLFADTVRENLLLGEKNITEEEMRYACHLALADHFIEHLPLGYDTKLGENGCELSGGQKQRLAIARALLRKPRILIFDEATSNLDTITENAIKDTISHLDSNITCIIIAHRLSTVKNCDRIYVMEQGQIVETGTHEELLKKGGKYAQMWDRQ